MSKNILLISVDILKERTDIHGNVDPKLIYPHIKYVQDAFIKPILGTALFDKLQSLISAESIGDGGYADYKLLLDEYLIDTIIWYVKSELQVDISFQTWNKGVVRKQGESTEMPTMSELIDLAGRYKNKGEYYANRMKLFLIDQSSRNQKYPEYTNPGSTVDAITPEQRNFTMPIYLGGGDCNDNPYCNSGGFNGQPYHD
jgi:hypothetical protein